MLKLGLILTAPTIALWGFVYEYNYFAYLGIPIPRGTSFLHYFASGMRPLFSILLIIILFATAKYLFTTKPQEASDKILIKTNALVADAKLKGIRGKKISAGLSILVSFLFYLTVSYNLRIPIILPENSLGLGVIWYYMIYVAFYLSLPLLYFEEIPSKLFAYILLIIAIAFVYASGGVFEAQSASSNNGLIRDSIFRVTNTGTSFDAKAKPILEKFVAFFKVPFFNP